MVMPIHIALRKLKLWGARGYRSWSLQRGAAFGSYLGTNIRFAVRPALESSA